MGNYIKSKFKPHLCNNFNSYNGFIVTKLFGTVNDSGRNIFGAAKRFDPKVFKLPCGAHRMNSVMKDLFVEQTIITEIGDKAVVYLYVRKWDSELEKFDKVRITAKDAVEIQNLNNVKIIFII